MACNCGKKQNVGSQPIVKNPSKKNIIGGTGKSGSALRRIIKRAK